MHSLNRAGRRQHERALLVPPDTAAQRAAQLADRQNRRAMNAQIKRDRDGSLLQRGSLAIAFLAQVDVHRETGAVPAKAVRLLELIFDQGAEILTLPDPDDEEDEDEEDEDEDERAN